MRLSFKLNGHAVSLEADPRARLIDVLRSSFHLFGAREGCGEGECGSCTVLFNGLPAASCLVFAGQADGADIRTVEGLDDPAALAIKEAFLTHGAVQCGFCTPGMLVSSYHLLRSNASPSAEEIRTALSGNLCRCTGYMKIFEAVGAAACKIAGKAGGKSFE
jgi:aerobic carbon-monoxide dehydrogenase small subunit